MSPVFSPRFLLRSTLFLLCVQCLPHQLSSQKPALNGFCGIRNGSTAPGEVLKYKVFYTLAGAYFNAGEATFSNVLETYQQKPVYHLSGEGHTYPSYDWFYRVRDLYESFVDTATMLPLKFLRNVHERNYRVYNSALFNHKTLQVVTTHGVFTIPSCTQDVLSAIYYARNIDYHQFSPGEKIPFNLYLDDTVYPIFIRYLGKETIKTRYGKFRAIKFKPLLIEGTIFKGGEDMTVWVSDDANKVPLMVETPILIGSIRVYLSAWQGLRHPATAFLSK